MVKECLLTYFFMFNASIKMSLEISKPIKLLRRYNLMKKYDSGCDYSEFR